MSKTYEQIAICKIKTAITQIKQGTSPSKTKAPYFLNRLKPLNPYMHQDLLQQYILAVKTQK